MSTDTTIYPRLPLSRFNKLINLAMNRLFAARDLNITREQEVILRELSRVDGLNQVDLAQRIGQDKDNLSRTLSLLEKKGLVRRLACSEDKRKIRVYITKEGQDLHKEAYEAIGEYRRVLFRNFQQKEIDDFSQALYHLLDNLAFFLEQDKAQAKPKKRAAPSPRKKARKKEPSITS